MTSLLRQIVAGPRAKHAETGLDLCYVTSNIIATSGPSQTYPQRAYRNPLDRLVAFLDSAHGDNWAIWEFRGEGTGYPDEAVYGRIRHYPWPDHHPPPFRLVPMIMASMREWLEGGEDATSKPKDDSKVGDSSEGKKHIDGIVEAKRLAKSEIAGNGRVVVVHCKAGKGRSGSMATSYLISQCGWTVEDAIARFTERRMRPGFGAGVSIPSQIRWIGYVDRWTKTGKKYVDRDVEIVEIHVWGLRHGVKLCVEGFTEGGKRIEVMHTFKADERFVVEGDAPGGSGLGDMISDMASYAFSPREDMDLDEAQEKADAASQKGNGKDKADDSGNESSGPERSHSKKVKEGIMRKISRRGPRPQHKSKTIDTSNLSSISSSATSISNTANDAASQPTASQPTLQPANTPSPTPPKKIDSNPYASASEPGGRAVIFKPSSPITLSHGDVNVTIERRNRAPASMGLTMVTAVAHVWFNTFFEGNGPEQDGRADDSGVFEIEWDEMDGIKGSSRKGTRAADKIAVVWRVKKEGDEGAVPTVEVHEPKEGGEVPQMEPADWKGGNREDPEKEKGLGLRKENPESADVSRASSVKDVDIGGGEDEDDEATRGLKTSGPGGELLGERLRGNSPVPPGKVDQAVSVEAKGEKADPTAPQKG